MAEQLAGPQPVEDTTTVHELDRADANDVHGSGGLSGLLKDRGPGREEGDLRPANDVAQRRVADGIERWTRSKERLDIHGVSIDLHPIPRKREPCGADLKSLPATPDGDRAGGSPVKLAVMRRGVVILLYVAILVGEMSWSAVAPLLPSFAQRFSLSDSKAGVILSIASLAILVVSIPAGAITRRIGARRLTVGSAVMMTLGDVALGTASSYGLLLVGRALFGLGMGMLWVGSTSWLHDVAGEERTKALSMTSAVIGIGSLVGPAFAGVVGERFGLGAPFLVLAVGSVVAGIVLFLQPSGAAHATHEDEPSFTEMIRAAGSDDMIRGSVALMLIGSLLWLTVYLLVPLRLDARGWSAANIGVAFSVSSLLYAGVSWVVARRADRWATFGVAAAATAGLAASLVVVVVSGSVDATVGFLMFAGVTTAVMIALTFPLGVAGPRRVSVALVGGLLNAAWAISGLIGPTLGGVAAQTIGDRATFSLLAIITAGAALWMVGVRQRLRRSSLGQVRA
jgi:predicted MFS family arabinose efflux permease